MAWKANNPPNGRRRVMVVADPYPESMGALQYALSHAMHDNDDVILLHVINSKRANSIKSLFRRHSDPGTGTISNFDPMLAPIEGSSRGGGCDFLEMMKRACKGAYPNSRVWIEKVEGNLDNKGVVILEKCKEMFVGLLVIGQRRHLVSVLFGSGRHMSIGRFSRSADTVEYLIEKSPCTCVAVQKKGQNSGYILNSRTHRNFWLLV